MAITAAPEEAKEVIRKIRREAELLRSVIAETQQQHKASRQLLRESLLLGLRPTLLTALALEHAHDLTVLRV